MRLVKLHARAAGSGRNPLKKAGKFFRWQPFNAAIPGKQLFRRISWAINNIHLQASKGATFLWRLAVRQAHPGSAVTGRFFQAAVVWPDHRLSAGRREASDDFYLFARVIYYRAGALCAQPVCAVVAGRFTVLLHGQSLIGVLKKMPRS